MRAPLALVLALVTACGAKPAARTSSAATEPVLYDRIGRMDAIHGLVKDFVEDQLLKGSLAARFANVDIPRFKDSLATQLCELSGGPCKYNGLSMREVLAGMALSDADFTVFVAGFQQSLAKFKVDTAEQNELFAIVRRFHDDIVEAS